MAQQQPLLTPERFAAILREIAENSDLEQAHTEADNLLCMALCQLGYHEGVAVFQQMTKWVA